MVVLFLAAGITHAAFYRTIAPNIGFNYGYGYGFEDGYGYGYGYGYGDYESDSGKANYGFYGSEGNATAVSTSSDRSSFTVNYTASYLAKNKVEYGTTSSLGNETSQTDFQKGSNSIIVSGLTCGTVYYYRVATEDAGGNVWRTSINTVKTSACTTGGGGGFSTPPTSGEETGKEETEAKEDLLDKPISDMTHEEIISKLTELKIKLVNLIGQLIVKLQEQLTVLQQKQEGEVKAEDCFISSFDRNLQLGSSGNDVKCLQIILNQSADTKLTETGGGSPGQETDYFGSLTQRAVIKYQEKHAAEILAPYGLTRGTGYVGDATRSKLNQAIGK
ncbi:MAG: hypothetical protein WDA06_01040 [Phenylobacterium sp.]